MKTGQGMVIHTPESPTLRYRAQPELLVDKFTTVALRQLRSSGRAALQLLWLLAGALLREDRVMSSYLGMLCRRPGWLLSPPVTARSEGPAQKSVFVATG